MILPRDNSMAVAAVVTRVRVIWPTILICFIFSGIPTRTHPSFSFTPKCLGKVMPEDKRGVVPLKLGIVSALYNRVALNTDKLKVVAIPNGFLNRLVEYSLIAHHLFICHITAPYNLVRPLRVIYRARYD